MPRMRWNQLLSAVPTRELEGGKARAGRRPEDARTPFDQDFDRVIFSTAVRRLQDKAQVFPLDPLDIVRTRLTHSHEVSTVVRGLARSVTRWLEGEAHVDGQQAQDIQVIAATCGLLHDLGNPPFGHAGEDAIQEWFDSKLSTETEKGQLLLKDLGGGDSQQAQDFLRFDGNAQTIRLVAHLQMLSDRHGLNLTAGTVSALGKYTARSNEIDRTQAERKKPGFFWSEDELIEQIRDVTGTGSAKNPIAFLVEAADDIVYSSVDVEDGVRRGVLDWETLSEEMEKAVGASATRMIKRAEAYIDDGGLELSGPSKDEARMQILRTFLIGEHVPGATAAFQKYYAEIMEGGYHKELIEDSETSDLLGACKDIGGRLVYPTRDILRLEVMGRGLIHELMDTFWFAAENAPPTSPKSFAGKIYKLISSSYKTLFAQDIRGGNSATYWRLRLVADYIAGMTDSFATRLHQQLKNG